MIDIKNLRLNPEAYEDSAKKRGIKVDIAKILKLDAERLELLPKVEAMRAKLNFKGKPDAAELKGLQKDKGELQKLETKLAAIDAEFHQLLLSVPNLIADGVPTGKDDSENQVIRKVGEPTKFDFDPLEHWDLGWRLGLIDNEKAAEVSGSRFVYLKGALAKLQFVLIQFVINALTDQDVVASIVNESGLKVSDKPFSLVIPPAMIRSEVLEKMARLEPKEDRYYLPDDDLYLSGSAEHTLGPLHLGEILEETELPIRYLGYSTAFRREAGSYGKDVKGILRLHQFDKLEMESFCLPETSKDEQDFLVAVQEYLLQKLELPYQVVAICTGDMGDPDARQIDIETWLPGQNKYRETHTADLMTDYQSRRLNTRVRRGTGPTELVHMNDATAMAIGRMLIAIMENYQTKEGKVNIPEALQKYYGGSEL